jgi:predicted metalloprotease with PDZ domain
MRVSWDIPNSAPKDLHFTSSFSGEAVNGTAITGVPSKTLGGTVIAVGQKLQRWPAWDVDITNHNGHEFATYWMESMPWNSAEPASTAMHIFNGTANYFGDYNSPFRVFFRHDWASYGGVGSFQSFLIEYRPGAEEESSLDSLIRMLSHEIIHNYALLWPDDSDYTNWYTEGIAEYLSIMSPYLSNTINRTHWIRWMNEETQAYYTGSSVLSRSWDDVIADYWSRGLANIMTPYTRGFMYLVHVQGLINDATNGRNSIDDVILPMYELYKDGKTVGKDEFVNFLGKLIGKEAADLSYEMMRNGTTLHASTTAYAKFNLIVVRKDAPKFDIGMNDNSISRKNVTGLVPGSNAERAGLREGDQIISSYGTWDLMERLDSMMRMVIQRDGKNLTFNYSPRSTSVIVENWEWVDSAKVL